MLILALESSAKPASAAICEDTELLGQYFQNNGLTHSRTILSMTESLLKNLDLAISDVGLIAVSSGPGSFTGVRIGVSAAKGLAYGLDIPVCGVSTLEAMAHQVTHGKHGDGKQGDGSLAWKQGDRKQGGGSLVLSDIQGKIPPVRSERSGRESYGNTREPSPGVPCVICPVMDARRGQVYNALFGLNGDKPVRLCDDRAISLEDLSACLAEYDAPCLLVGDGAALSYEYLCSKGIDCRMAPDLLRWQTAYGVALASAGKEPIRSALLEPSYLRPSQAEREYRGC